ncbi:hypothetical protein [Rhizobium sp. P44RR-XXIV]|uniref:hypothetical protein n=1 Tax=Rhizobium sp. P44RR-XXIV TaxID=1921145 RepID=UPI0009866911|nr:hypothetical protein [Rhizobium sp. P44RR-XXIV]TIX90491.1 hypothetical protein BSK43_014560 [Rhizobium sp. P44RR-XXIV]
MYMTLGGLFGRIALQLLCGFVLVAVTGGGLVWIIVMFLLVPCIGMSVFIFAPIEYFAARFGVRWLAWIVTPFVGAGIPWLFEFIAPNRANFLAGISQLCFVSGVMGVLWTVSSVTAAFLQQPPVPDKRLFD